MKKSEFWTKHKFIEKIEIPKDVCNLIFLPIENNSLNLFFEYLYSPEYPVLSCHYTIRTSYYFEDCDYPYVVFGIPYPESFNKDMIDFINTNSEGSQVAFLSPSLR